jgi:hypothetical protein
MSGFTGLSGFFFASYVYIRSIQPAGAKLISEVWLILSKKINEYKATMDIRACEILVGNLPKKQIKSVLAWAELHQEEFIANRKLVMTRGFYLIGQYCQ